MQEPSGRTAMKLYSGHAVAPSDLLRSAHAGDNRDGDHLVAVTGRPTSNSVSRSSQLARRRLLAARDASARGARSAPVSVSDRAAVSNADQAAVARKATDTDAPHTQFFEVGGIHLRADKDHVDRLRRDGGDDRLNVFRLGDARGVEHVGAGLDIGLEPIDRSADVRIPDQEAFSAADEHDIWGWRPAPSARP